MKNLALLAVLCGSFGSSACGEVVGARLPDAGSGSQSPDASTVDASLSGSATVITQSQIDGSGNTGDIVPNIAIYSLRPNETLEAMGMTDATGSATIQIYPGGSVTAVYPHTGSGDSGYDFATYLDVEDGDTLTFGSDTTLEPTTDVGTVNFTWNAYAAADYYYIYTGCNEYYVASPGVSTGAEEITSDCVHTGTPFFAQIVAYNTSGSAFATTTGEIATVSGAATLSFGTLTALGASANVAVAVSGLPAEIDDVDLDIIDIADGGNELASVGSSGPPNGGAFNSTIASIQGGDRTVGLIEMFPTSGDLGRMFLYDKLATFSTSWSVASPVLPPWVTSAVAPPGTTQILWFPVTTPGTTTEQGATVQYEWEKSAIVDGVNTSTDYNWTFIVPPGVTTLSLPSTLPSNLAAMLPGPDDEVDTPTVHLLQVPSVVGYKGLKTIPERDLVCPSCGVEAGEVSGVAYSQVFIPLRGATKQAGLRHQAARVHGVHVGN